MGNLKNLFIIMTLLFGLSAQAYEPPFDSGTRTAYRCDIKDNSGHDGVVNLDFIEHHGRQGTWAEGAMAYYIFGTLEFLDLFGAIRGENQTAWIAKSFSDHDDLVRTRDINTAFSKAIRNLNSFEGILIDGLTTLKFSGTVHALQISINTGTETILAHGGCRHI